MVGLRFAYRASSERHAVVSIFHALFAGITLNTICVRGAIIIAHAGEGPVRSQWHARDHRPLPIAVASGASDERDPPTLHLGRCCFAGNESDGFYSGGRTSRPQRVVLPYGDTGQPNSRFDAELPARALSLRGGDAATSSRNSDDRGPSWNVKFFEWGPNGNREAEAAAGEGSLERQHREEAATREALRKARDERLQRELDESAATLLDGEDKKDGGGLLVPIDLVASSRVSSPKDTRLWLDAVEGVVGGISLTFGSLYPVWHALRAMFGLSLLFYGQDFSTLAFHIVVFRLSGWEKAARSKDELVAYYKKARLAMTKAARDVRTTAALMDRKDELKARKKEMMMEKRRLHKMGRVSAEEARAFIDKYRQDIEQIAQEQESLATASNSVLAIKKALSIKKLVASLNSLYAAVITSITASTFKRAGQLTLALTCGGLIKKALFDLLGPVIDPIGYQIELETYVANIMRGPANFYITAIGFLGSACMFFHFFVDPRQALLITFVLLGARVVTDYIIAALNPVRWRFGVSKRLEHMPVSAAIYLSLALAGFVLHERAGVIGDYICKPYIAFLRILNELLNRFQISTISYFS